MYFNIKCIGKLLGPRNEFERSLVFETGEFERPKFDCTLETSTCDPLKYTIVDSPLLIESICMGKSIRIQRVKVLCMCTY